MYSDPLLGENCKDALEGVKYEEEIVSLKERLSRVKKRITMKITVLTKDSLIDLCSEKPKVLHLMCHGSYEKIKK